MIATLSGRLSEKLDNINIVVIDIQGIGYGVQVAASDYSNLATGEQTKLYIYESVRETTYDLYGFTKKLDKVFFELLLTVNGVGPKMALSILSMGTSDAVRTAIAAGDTKYLQAASGVGKRVAERVIVDLKDKVGLPSQEGATDFLQGATLQDDAVQALVSLGFTPQDAVVALQKIDPSLSTEERLKLALKERL